MIQAKFIKPSKYSCNDFTETFFDSMCLPTPLHVQDGTHSQLNRFSFSSGIYHKNVKEPNLR